MSYQTSAASETSTDEMIHHLNSDGIVFLTDFLSEEQLVQLNSEHEQILCSKGSEGKENGGKGTGIDIVEMEVGRAAILHRLQNNHFSETDRVFGSDLMDEVSSRFFDSNFELNTDVYVLHEEIGTKHIAQDLHFDVIPTLKFFIYLNDVSRSNGAFSCVPGSHKLTQEIRASQAAQITFENREITRTHSFAEEQIVPVEGPAGGLIIFTTEVWHRAGKITEGERKLMRGHTRATLNEKVHAPAPSGRFRRFKQLLGLS